MVKYGKRKKRPVPTPPRKLPPPKVIPGGIQQRPYKAEKPEGVPPKHEIPASEIPKGKGVLLHPSSATIKEGAPDEVVKKIARRNNLIAAAVTIPIVLGVVLLTPYIIWGHAWWEHPWGFGGGGGGGAQTWQIISESGGVGTLAVDTSGNFTGSGWYGYAAGIGYYDIYITNGRMSGTSMTFQVSASYGSGSISGTYTGTLNPSFPSATSASGTGSGTISDPLGTRGFTDSWTATRQS